MLTKYQSLTGLREKIDAIDDQILELISSRAKLADSVAQAKRGAATYRPERESQILERVATQNSSPLPSSAIQAIFREIIASCRNLDQPTTISYLGPAGSYSELAARQQFGQTNHLLPQDNLTEVFGAAEKGTAQLAVVPIENSIEGTVNLTLDLLRQTNLVISAEMLLPIHHQLLTHTKSLRDITEIIAHPQALAQCNEWLVRNLPHAKRTEAASNAAGAKLAATSPNLAAIAGEAAASIYQLPILAANIEDQSTNTTRFLVVGTAKPTPTGRDKTSLICITPNKPGALYQLLDCLARHDVNMTKLEARPSRENNWDYIFFIDIQGHQDNPAVADALRDLREKATLVKILGSYPAAKAA